MSHKPTGGDKVSTRDGKTKFEISRFEICLMRPEEGRSHLPPPFSLFFNAACHAHYHRAAAAKQRHSVVWLHRKRSQSFHVDKNETIKSINILQKASVTLCFISRQVLHRTIPICLPSSHLYDSRFESLVI